MASVAYFGKFRKRLYGIFLELAPEKRSFFKKFEKGLYIRRKVWYTNLASENRIAYAPVAQLDRALDSDSKGRWFESSRAYQKPSQTIRLRRFLYAES